MPSASLSKRVATRNHSYEIVFHLQLHFHENQTYFHMKGFARGLVLKQRYNVTRRWPFEMRIKIAHHVTANTDLQSFVG